MIVEGDKCPVHRLLRKFLLCIHVTFIARSNYALPTQTLNFQSVFQPRVSFDTFPRASSQAPENADITSFTLARRHKDYAFTKRSRTFLCGLDANDYSEYALEWLIDELVDDGDEVVCLRVIDSNAEVVVGGGKKGESK